MQTQILDAIINNNGGDTIGNCQYIKIRTWLIDLGEYNKRNQWHQG